ncbi:hypothetical protein [Streptomyces sp. NEAU-YJ-81]|nr:hypothetical protein [Streptomyces sp. NEAU-YJ-81]MBO3682896.1 hypothetical protein [Streptomyces sp. NEAU-YJ-81]
MALLAALDSDFGLYYLQGLGRGGLERIHDQMRRLEQLDRGDSQTYGH